MERPPIHALEVFLTIVREGSLRSAASVLGVGAPAVSLQLKALEERLGVELLIRTTRRIELTDAGRMLVTTAGPAYRDLIDAMRQTREMSQSATGTLRLNMSRGAYMAVVAPALPKFQRENPGIDLDISWNEGLVDIAREGFHAGLRLGDVLEPDMVAVKVSELQPTAFFASPAYLKEFGRPNCPRDLLEHRCIRYREPTSGKLRDWIVVEDGQDTRIDPPGSLVFDAVVGVIQAARDGLGIGWSMCVTAKEHLQSGQLETVLDGFSKEIPPFYLYFPKQNRRVECLRLFVDCLKASYRSANAN
ncbi:MAG: LysR family transcriptional regulator [Roseibium sp.]|uniref:LysR family transcriptional regulator n=1 Tax=Roseibium sp. TaxID=1936156 RepID=UPI00262BE9FB|nr:LysR family transcriptional regulator [Roseibium sp.]MCV0426420.1 LysR family transcriptional regulator [Roseibium sp.]